MNILKTIVKSLDKVRSEEITIYNMEGVSPLFDYVIIATVDSSRQADAVTAYLKEDLSTDGFDVKNIEGKNTAWVLVDCYDVLVHVFTREEREHYSLDKMYMDIEKIDVEKLR